MAVNCLMLLTGKEDTSSIPSPSEAINAFRILSLSNTYVTQANIMSNCLGASTKLESFLFKGIDKAAYEGYTHSPICNVASTT